MTSEDEWCVAPLDGLAGSIFSLTIATSFSSRPKGLGKTMIAQNIANQAVVAGPQRSHGSLRPPGSEDRGHASSPCSPGSAGLYRGRPPTDGPRAAA